MRILIAEDDPITRHLLVMLLESWGYEVVPVSDGAAAWQALEKDDLLSLAIFDWMMPGLNGIDLVRRLRARRDSRPYTYVVLLTAKTAKAEILEALYAGFDDYLSKPFDPEELQAKLVVGKRILDLQARLRNALCIAQRQASHDSLTGLLNRTAIIDTLAKEIDRARRSGALLSVALLDIDHFKLINDSHGHLIGDEVLRCAAERIRQAVRTYDKVGRFGGEEFLIIIPGAGSEEAFTIGERICKALKGTPVPAAKSNVTVTASIGISVVNPASEMRENLHWADEALYRAKKKGRNRVEVVCPGVDRPFPNALPSRTGPYES